MKKIYLLFLFISMFLCNVATAQKVTSENDPSYIMLGYNEPIGTIYQYDGIGGADVDGTVGCAARITAEMLRPYAGAEISALNVGWSDPDMPGSCQLFVRNSINGEDIASAEAQLMFGWNEIELDKKIKVPENPGDIYIGYFVYVPANTICVPTFYPRGIAGSCLLWREGETEADGSRRWTDMCDDFGSIALQAKVQDPTDRFFDMLEVTGTRNYSLQVLGEESRFDFSVRNRGMNEIYSVTTLFEQDGKTFEYECAMPAPLYPGCTADVHGRMKAVGSGKINFSVTEIDGAPNKTVGERVLDVTAMPRSVADKYRRTPLMEFFESEGINIIPKYYNEFFLPGYAGYEDDIILVQHHVGDGFCVGKDESLGMMLDIVDNDSTLITVPVMMLDRTDYIDMPVKFDYTPMFSILFPDFARPLYDFAIKMPTFAEVSVAASADDDTRKGTVKVTGNIEGGIIPAGEHLYITVYLIKKSEFSNQQQFLSQEEMDLYCDPDTKMYEHHNVLRQTLTPMIGEELDVESGSFERTYDFTLDKYDSADDMQAVAFITRGAHNTNRYNKYVLNAARADVGNANSIYTAAAGGISVIAEGGRINVSGSYDRFEVYDVTGARTASSSLAPGMYVVKVYSGSDVASFKVFIN